MKNIINKNKNLGGGNSPFIMIETCGIFLINIENKILLIHPTLHPKNVWSIPKGKKEEGETRWQAARREFKEETDIDISEEKSILFTTEQEYTNKKKRLIAFFIEGNAFDHEFKCNTFFQYKGLNIPECDDLKWFTFEEAKQLLHESQLNALEEFENN